jgi:hypothetical protein
MAFAHGASGAIGIQGFASGAAIPSSLVTLKIKSWDAEYTKKDHDTSNTSVTGFTVAQPGKATCTFSVEAELELNSGATGFNNTTNPVASVGVNLQADYCSAVLVGGTTQGGTAVTTVATGSANQLFNIPTAIVKSIKISNKEGDIITYSIQGMSSGPFTINGGS